MTITIDGKAYQVTVAYGEEADSLEKPAAPPNPAPESNGHSLAVKAPLEGKFRLVKDPSEKPIKVGDAIKTGDTLGYIEAMKVMNALTAPQPGRVKAIVAQNGQDVLEDDDLITLEL